MNSRERVLSALQHKEPDRVPRDLGGTESSGMTAHALRRLADHLNMPSELKIFEPYQYVAYIGGELRERFKIDTSNLTLEPEFWSTRSNPMGFDVMLPEKWNEDDAEDGSTTVCSSDGTVIARRPKDGYYFDPTNPPLEHISEPGDIEKHKNIITSFDHPSFADESFEQLRSRAQTMHASGSCVVFNLCCHILAAGQMLRGYENFMVDLLTDEKMVRTLLDILLEGYRSRLNKLAPVLKDHVDVLLLNDDLGTQNGPVLSLSAYREMIKPYQKILFDHAKQTFAKPILFHSCGAVREFIPELIELGVDALNPVQLSAEGMDPKDLKQDFGKDITLWGGGVDTQSVLNKSTPQQVMDSVKQNIDILAPGGGFVFCQVHNIQPDVPPQNVEAMFKALDEYGSY